MNLSIIPPAFDALRKGETLAHPALWKTGGEVLKAAIVALALSVSTLSQALGYDLHIDDAAAAGIGAVVAWVVGLFFTAATSPTVGILPAKPAPVSESDREAP